MPVNYDLLKLTPPEPTVKVMSAQDYLSGAQAIREARRKKAIEEAVRSGIDAKGDMNTEAMRQSLIAQGFGEDADRVVRDISMARLGDISTTFDVGTKLKAGVDAGIISPEIAQRAMGTTSQIVRTPFEEKQDLSMFEGVPGAALSQESTYQTEPTEDGFVRIPRPTDDMAPLYNQTTVDTKAQAVPEYSANLINFAKKQNEESLGEIRTSGTELKYTLPEGTDKQYILDAAKTLGYTGSTSIEIDAELTQRAMSQVPKPVLTPKGYGAKDLLEAQAEFAQKMTEYPALIAQKKAELIKQLEAGQSARFGQERARKSESMAEDTQSRERAEFTRKREAAKTLVDQGITSKLMPDADVTALQDKFVPALDDIVKATQGFGGAMGAAVAMAKIDGSVNADNVISKLVAGGAMTSSDAAKLKALMSPEAYSNLSMIMKGGSLDAAQKVLGSLGIELGEGRGMSDAWKKAALHNVYKQAKTHGMTSKYFSDITGEPLSAAETLRSKGVGQTKPTQDKSPKVGDKRSDGKVWTGKAWR
jgi:hypothetical protein